MQLVAIRNEENKEKEQARRRGFDPRQSCWICRPRLTVTQRQNRLEVVGSTLVSHAGFVGPG